MIPQRAEILPRNVTSSDQKPLRKGVFLSADKMGNPLLGIKDPSKPLTNEMRDPWAYMTHLTATRYAYEALLSSPFSRPNIIGSRDGYGSFDFSILSGARRKNATRETTSPLKAWLHEHRKNPYPTKGEKIMLAILTKMTLTQISTWFANARRRLKKDNKMTWSPRNKSSEKKDAPSKCSKTDKDVKNDDNCTEDEEMACSVEKNQDSNMAESQEMINMEDIDLENEEFSDDGSSVDLNQNAETADQMSESKSNNNNNNCNNNNEKPVWPQLSDKSSTELIKKLEYNASVSPVGDLQRWVDGHFGSQSPVDFPRELTPPRTPVEEVIFNGALSSRDLIQEKKLRLEDAEAKHKPRRPLPSILESSDKDAEMTPKSSSSSPMTSSEVMTSSNVTSSGMTLFSEELARSVAMNDSRLHNQFRTSGLTSHREIDAVLALTALSSR